MERQIPTPGQRYVDEKQRPYQVLCIAKCEETGEKMVVYQMLCGEFEYFVKPIGMFAGEDDTETAKSERAENTEGGEEEQADPVLLQFLDTDTFEEKYQLLKSLRGVITDRLIDDFSVTLDLVIPEGDTNVRYQQLLNSVRTMQKFETTRFRSM